MDYFLKLLSIVEVPSVIRECRGSMLTFTFLRQSEQLGAHEGATFLNPDGWILNPLINSSNGVKNSHLNLKNSNPKEAHCSPRYTYEAEH